MTRRAPSGHGLPARCLATTALACALLPAAGHAQPLPSAAGGYLGLGVGGSNVGDTPDVVPLPGAPAAAFSSDQRDPGVKVVAGYRFGRHFALEGGYAWLGEFQFANAPGGPGGALIAESRVIGLFADAVGLLPLRWGFTALGRVGVIGSEVRTTRLASGGVAVPPGLPATASADEANLKVGLGLQYDLGPRAAVRAEWDRYVGLGNALTGEVDLDVYSIGVVLRF